MNRLIKHLIIQLLILLGCILGIVWALQSSRVSRVDYKSEPNLFLKARRTTKLPKETIYMDNTIKSRKTPPAEPRTLAALTGTPDKTFKAWITAYNPLRSQTDATPFTTASGKQVNSKTMACPQWIPFGTKVEIEGLDLIRICEDRMHPKYPYRFDLLFRNKNRALNWGKRYRQIKLYY